MRTVSNFVLGLVAIAACWQAWHVVYLDSQARTEVDAPAKPQECLAVEVLPARKQSVSDRIALVGGLEPLAEVELRARVNGYVSGIPLDLGDRVTTGQVVVALDETAAAESVAQAEATLRVAAAELAAQKTAADQTVRHLERTKSLYATKAATEQQLEEAESQVEIAAARVLLEQARIEQAQASLSKANANLRELALISPIDGVVAERLVHVGDLAQPNTPLMRIVSLEKLLTVVHVTERDYDRIQAGQEAVLTVDAHPNKVFRGVVSRVAPTLDAATRTAAIRIEADNSRGLLRPGMHTRVTVLCETPRSAGVVPVAAVKQDEQGTCVFVVQGEPPTIERREVRLGLNDGRIAEILAGLKPGEQVVTLGSRLVRHGQVVNPIEASWPVSLVDTASQPGDAAAE
ncbi:MAG: efflux RND transporter periplasmic adaptor subunit [Planctomycetaceae bacterium]|nr:efflux RND transporter periplasmic adaptor subunit [Planctomycetaceae bacterium]